MKKSTDKTAGSERPFEHYVPDLHRFLLRFLRKPQDAEDIRQEVFARISRISDQQLARDPKAYLFGVAFHVIREFQMRRRRERVNFDSDALQAALDDRSEAQTDDLAERLNIQQQLDRALGELPPKERAVLLLVKRDGMSYEEAADAAGMSVHQVERYVASARMKLKLWLWDR